MTEEKWGQLKHTAVVATHEQRAALDLCRGDLDTPFPASHKHIVVHSVVRTGDFFLAVQVSGVNAGGSPICEHPKWRSSAIIDQFFSKHPLLVIGHRGALVFDRVVYR